MRHVKVKIISSIGLLYFFWPGLSLAASPLPLPVYISQVQATGGKNNTSEDFIELFNPNSSAVNLKGYRLVKRAQNGSADADIKSWTKDASIPPKSFFLWANSAFTSIAVNPDATSAATISDDNGVALRFGASNTGTIVDSVAWGKSNNGFNNISAANPGADNALIRKNLYSATSSFTIAASNPHNSSYSDLSAAFGKSQPSVVNSNPKTPELTPTPTPVLPTLSKTNQAPTTTPSQNPPEVVENLDLAPSPAPFYSANHPTQTSATKYLILSIAALLALVFIGYQFAFNKKK